MKRPPSLATPPGAVLDADGTCVFRVWAPGREEVALVLHDPERVLPMERGQGGVFQVQVRDVREGLRYSYRLDGNLLRPDPASRSQPEGVHAPSAVVRARRPAPSPGFRCPALADLVLYELHVGTFTPEGTLDAAISRLEHLVRLGVNAVQLMPLAQFPGRRNWGYDGVYAFAVQDSYGGPAGLARFVDACHEVGLAVFLDVVYNHPGPEGNYLADFGPYFRERTVTPWGPSFNFDGCGSDGVRWHFLSSACYFLEEFGIDGFRIDAVHAFLDTSAWPFLAELTATLHARAERRGRPVHVIAESDLNDARILYPPEVGGHGMDAQWSDDFHHALHALLTRERQGYYQDFGRLLHLAVACREGWTYHGQWSSHRGRRHGNSPRLLEADRFVVYSQTHDQIGNRARGDRLGESLSFGQKKLAACAVFLSPFVPMFFMGQEYGELAPFAYFTSHGDPDLQRAVREGRRREFASFGWAPEDIPDPQDEATFAACRLDWSLLETEPHRTLLELHRELLALRRSLAAFQDRRKDGIEVEIHEPEEMLVVRRSFDGHEAVLLLAFARESVRVTLDLEPGDWRKLLDTEDARWSGTGTAVPGTLRSTGDVTLRVAQCSAVLLAREAAG